MDAVARTLPALWRAEKVKKKAAKTGFDWADVSGALDLLLAAVSVGRYLGADPEEALHAACDKFSARFRKTEELADASGQKMDELSEEELTALWREAKKQLD